MPTRYSYQIFLYGHNRQELGVLQYVLLQKLPCIVRSTWRRTQLNDWLDASDDPRLVIVVHEGRSSPLVRRTQETLELLARRFAYVPVLVLDMSSAIRGPIRANSVLRGVCKMREILESALALVHRKPMNKLKFPALVAGDADGK